MSYPQRPPIGMGMPYGYPMMPIGMTMMPMMRPGMQPMPSHQMMPQGMPRAPVMMVKRPPAPEPAKPNVPPGEKPPVTTVFVGNISEKAPDAMIRQMLQRCGNVLSWKRVQGASGKLQAFGFCEYEDPEATLRCIRLLNDWIIADKKLLVKVDAKTKSLLDEHNKKKKKKNETEEGESEEQEEGESREEEGEALDEATQREDRVAQAGLDAIMREYANELRREIPAQPVVVPPVSAPTSVKVDDKAKSSSSKPEDDRRRPDSIVIEDDKIDPIHREIRNFRDSHKEVEESRSRHDREKDREREREREQDRERRRRREEEREREREKERARDREERERRDREKEREREQRDREREKEREQRDKERAARDQQNSRSRTRERSADRRDKDVDAEDEEEAQERRRLERRLREKETAYQDLLKRWEAREKKKGKEYEKESEREDQRKKEESKEARRLKEFLDEYDDDRDDVKYYKGSALQRRLNEREKEMEADERDRMKERDELDEIRKRLIEDGHPDPDAEMAKIEREREEHLMPRLTHVSPDRDSPHRSPMSDHSDVIPLDDDDEDIYDRNDRQPFDENTWNTPQEITAAPDVTEPFQRAQESNYSSPRSPLQPLTNKPTKQPAGSGSGKEVAYNSPPPQKSKAPPSYTMSDDSASGFSNSLGASALEGLQASSAPTAVPPPATNNSSSKSKLGFSGLKLGEITQAPSSPSDAQKRKKLSVGDVFNNDDDDEASAAAKKRKLIPLTYSEEEKAALQPTSAEAAAQRAAALLNKPTSAEEKRKCIKNLIERIPTAKEELFAFKLDWSMVDTTLMDRRIKPWVNKKIVEYIGEDEPTLSEFICKKVMANSQPDAILSDISMVLDDEAEVFVVKMWRLLIYETEAKKLGLVK